MSIINRISPDTMHKNPAYSQVATVDASAKLVYVGGQNGVDKEVKIVGKDIASQSEQAMKNMVTALEAGGATMDDVFKISIYMVQGQSVQDAFGAAMKVAKIPPAIVTMLYVAGLGRPEFLIEIEAIAAVSGKS